MKTRKHYVAPVIVTYGAVKELTRQSDQANTDVPNGANGTAYSPV